MLTSKQRAQLRAMANNEDTIVYIGKSGITENIVKQAQGALKAREIVKCKVQENSPLSAREACDKMSELTQSEQIQVIGSRFVLYKRNPEDAKIVLVK